MSDTSNARASAPSNSGITRQTPAAYRLPPELPLLKTFLLWGARVLIVVPVSFLGVVCLQLVLGAAFDSPCPRWAHVALILFLIGLMLDRFLPHKLRVHREQVVDRSQVDALIQEARDVRPRPPLQNDGPQETRPLDFEQLKASVDAEVHRLHRIGPEAWTNYQVLTLDRQLIDFLPIEDLKARAQSSLVDLEDYAEGDAFSYNARLYTHWKATIDEDIKEIEGCTDEQERDRVADKLRADLRSLLEHVANYESTWAEGKTIVHAIRICGSAAVVAFVLMGLLGIIYHTFDAACVSSQPLGVLHWGLLGSAGALTSALNNLRDSIEVEVGDTRGVQVLWQTVLGATLGFVAGILIFSALAGGLITDGSAVPKLPATTSKDIYLSIVWAIGAGMGFQSVFQRVRSAVGS